MSAIMELSSISVRYSDQNVIDALSLEVNEGEILGVMGPNGAGKSTLLRIMSGIERATSGVITFSDKQLSKLAPRDRARSIAVVHQSNFFPFSIKSLDVVLMGLWPYMPPFGFESKHDVEQAMTAMEMCDCAAFAHRDVNLLSGGERQRVMIARALAQKPRLLLLDEPTSFLDLGHVIALRNIIKRLAKERSMTVVCALHDFGFASSTCDRVLLMRAGRSISVLPPVEALSPQHIKTAFGVDVEVNKCCSNFI